MTIFPRERLALGGLLLLGAVTFFGGITWGLPTRDIDPFLFGSPDKAWSAADIVAAGGAWTPDANRAADADPNPVEVRDRAVWLNETPKQRAEIVRRYRLFSYQPDEMVTFMALSGMPKTRGDPRMYQYGGMWIYPVGGMLKVASMVGLVDLRADMNFYLDRPEQFARFYVVARIYSALWGLIGVWAVFQLCRRFSDSLIVPAAAAACFALMPVIVNGAHEAKPHLAGVVLTLLAVLAATKYVETGRFKWAIVTGALCGLATGMVLSAAVAFVVLPLMTLLRRGAWAQRVRRAAAGVAVGVAAYCVTNPYVPINLVRNPQVVRENLGALSQAKAITGQSNDVGALRNARRLMADGASVMLNTLGTVGVIMLLMNRGYWHERAPARAAALLLAAPAGIALVQFVALAAGKPGEFGRFAMLPDVAIGIAAIVAVSSLDWARTWIEPAAYAFLVVMTAVQGFSYSAAFLEDARHAPTSTRAAAARRLEALAANGARTVGVRADPAPYSLPPVDLTRWKILLLPPTGAALPEGQDAPDVIVTPADDYGKLGDVAGTNYRREYIWGRWPRTRARISWADKPFELLIRKDLP